MFSSVRVRLTLWYVLVFGVLLSGFSLAIYLALSKSLYSRLDLSLASAAKTVVNSFQVETGERGGDAAAGAADTLSTLQLPDVYVAIYEGDHVLATNYPDGHPPTPPEALLAPESHGQMAFRTVSGFGEEGARQVWMPLQTKAGEYVVLITAPLHDLGEQLEAIQRTFYFGLPAALLAAGVGGFLLARKSLAPVVAMSNQAERISARNLHERLQIRNAKDELGHLASVFNELLSRLDRSFEGMRTFMADASHELRTPLSIIRGETDVALTQDRDPAEYKAALAIIQDEAKRLSRLVDDMLELARADAGQRPLRMADFYLNDLVDECCRAAQVLAAQKGISLQAEPAPDLSFSGDEDILRRMLLNLLDNAIKYTPAGGSVIVGIEAEAKAVRISVSDTGIGIPADALPQVFERFYRIAKARSRADGGSGLGLAIAKWAAEAHKGAIRVTSQLGRGSTFTVTLPL
ncbi:MAG TPA: ATP-binding protein [Blastocatellia bacterium]|nr:ATP-binding protein [Blastocatellia bacterium]